MASYKYHSELRGHRRAYSKQFTDIYSTLLLVRSSAASHKLGLASEPFGETCTYLVRKYTVYIYPVLGIILWCEEITRTPD